MQQPVRPPGGWWRRRLAPKLRRWREEFRRSREAQVTALTSCLLLLTLLALAGYVWRQRPPAAPLPAVAVPDAGFEPSALRPLTREELMWLEDRQPDSSPEALYEDSLLLTRLQTAATLDELRRLPANRVSISNAALLLARRYHRESDPAPLEQQLLDLARACGLRLSAGMLPSRKVEILLRFIYLRDRFVCDPDNEWFDDLLVRGRGGEAPLGVLLLALGQRLEIPFHAVRTPQGFWLRIPIEGGTARYINAADGSTTDLAGARQKLGLSDLTVRRAGWLAELDAHAVTAELLARQALTLQRLERAAEAQELVTLGLQFDPASPKLKDLQGTMLAASQPQTALPLLAEAANRYGAGQAAQLLYGRALRAAGKPDEALPWLIKASDGGNDSAAWLERALCRAELRQHELAVADYQKAAQLRPGDMAVARGLGNAYVEWGVELDRQRKKSDAEQAFTQAIILYPRNARAFFCRAQVRINQNKRDQAIEDLRAALALEPNYGEARRLLARYEPSAATQ